MAEESKIDKVREQYMELIKAFYSVSKIIGHTLTYRTLFQDIIILTLSHAQVNNEISNEKLYFIVSLFEFKVDENDDIIENLKKNANMKPCPYPLEYRIPTTFKIAVNMDIITGNYYLTKVYYEFIKLLFDLINNTFDDMNFDKIQFSISFIDELNGYILSSILKNQ